MSAVDQESRASFPAACRTSAPSTTPLGARPRRSWPTHSFRTARFRNGRVVSSNRNRHGRWKVTYTKEVDKRKSLVHFFGVNPRTMHHFESLPITPSPDRSAGPHTPKLL